MSPQITAKERVERQQKETRPMDELVLVPVSVTYSSTYHEVDRDGECECQTYDNDAVEEGVAKLITRQEAIKKNNLAPCYHGKCKWTLEEP